MRTVRALLLAAALGLVACGPSKPPLRMDEILGLDGWIEVRTSHFTLLSAAGEDRTLQLARDLEAFTGVMRAVAVSAGDVPVAPVRIYFFADQSSYGFYRSGRGVVGQFHQSALGPYILMSPQVLIARRILFHEYVHHLLKIHGDVTYPPWYNEGLAEFFSTVTFREHLISLGAVPSNRNATLRGEGLLSLERILAARNYADVEDSTVQFYAQSWLFTHFLHLGHYAGQPPRIPMLRSYLLSLQESSDWREAYASSFDIDVDLLGEALEAYRQRVADGRFIPRLRLDARKLAIDRGVAHEPVVPAEVAFQLGSIYLDLGPELALWGGHLFERALDRDPSHVGARAGLARVRGLTGDYEEARALAEKALVLDPDAAAPHRARGVVRILEGDSLRDDDPVRSAELREAGRADLRRAIEREPSFVESYVLLGRSYLGDDEPDVAPGLEALQRAHDALPWHDDINLDLARLHLASGERAAARRHAERALRWSHGDSFEAATELLAEIDAEGAGAD